MSDRIEAVIAVSRDDALPVDVQAVGLRRRAIDAMQEIATVDENTVRYRGGTDDGYISLGDRQVWTWQMNLLAASFVADGKALDGVVGPVIHHDEVTRTYSMASVERNEFD